MRKNSAVVPTSLTEFPREINHKTEPPTYLPHSMTVSHVEKIVKDLSFPSTRKVMEEILTHWFPFSVIHASICMSSASERSRFNSPPANRNPKGHRKTKKTETSNSPLPRPFLLHILKPKFPTHSTLQQHNYNKRFHRFWSCATQQSAVMSHLVPCNIVISTF